MAVINKYGIDFGTTNSSIALHNENDGIVETTIFNVDGVTGINKKLLPSLVYIDANGNTYVGTMAKKKYPDENISMNLKTLIRKVKLELDEKKDDIEIVRFGNRSYRISDVIAILLKELHLKARREHIVDIKGIVFGVPVTYSDDCKRIMLEATVKAGLCKDIKEAQSAVEFLSEPIAVAVDYGLNLNTNKNILVFDFGGGTLDLAVVRLRENEDGKGIHKVEGKERLTIGGELYTELFFKRTFIRKYGKKKLLEAFGYDKTLSVEEIWERMGKDSLGVAFIEKLEEAKCVLSIEDETYFHFSERDIVDGEIRYVDINCELTREELEEAIRESFDDIRNVILDCLRESRMDKSEIDEVLMAGGSSLIPSIIELLREIFGRDKVRNPNDNALTSIVKGLAIKGYQIDEKEWVDDVSDSNYGIWYGKQKRIDYIVKKNTRISETIVDKTNIESGMSRKVRAVDEQTPRIEVYQEKEKIGEFTLPYRGSGHYKIFFEIDKKHGWLIVHIYDTDFMHWYEDALEHKIKLG